MLLILPFVALESVPNKIGTDIDFHLEPRRQRGVECTSCNYQASDIHDNFYSLLHTLS